MAKHAFQLSDYWQLPQADFQLALDRRDIALERGSDRGLDDGLSGVVHGREISGGLAKAIESLAIDDELAHAEQLGRREKADPFKGLMRGQFDVDLLARPMIRDESGCWEQSTLSVFKQPLPENDRALLRAASGYRGTLLATREVSIAGYRRIAGGSRSKLHLVARLDRIYVPVSWRGFGYATLLASALIRTLEADLREISLAAERRNRDIEVTIDLQSQLEASAAAGALLEYLRSSLEHSLALEAEEFPWIEHFDLMTLR